MPFEQVTLNDILGRAIKRLEAIGVISIEHDNGRGNVYRLLDVPTEPETPDNHVRRPMTPMSGVPLTPVSPEQELKEQDLFNKTVASIFPVERKPSPQELKAYAADVKELKPMAPPN